ncbi:LuxR C-terminal-related transcriptional regulator [Dongia sp.]|uniref:LuxR C-terminal-related transcriptional regulator n=1 Tax=Dongia sp. TaxID=1977262 RepID=UPI0035B3ECDD
MNAVTSLARGLILVKPGGLDHLALRAFVRSAGVVARPKIIADFLELCELVSLDEPLRLVLLAAELTLEERRQLADLAAQRRDRPVLLRYGQYTLADIATDLRLGFGGHFARSVELDMLVPALQFVVAGNRYVSPEFLLAQSAGHPLEGEPGAGIFARLDASRPPTVPAELTPRHRQVLTELCQGATNLQIATRLGIAEATAKVHVHRILRLLGARNRTEAARKAQDLGILFS